MTTFRTEHLTGFGGTHFGILWGDDPRTMPGWAQDSHVATTHIPGGNVSVTQLLGFGAPTIAYRLFFEDRREFAAFMSLRQTQGTLTLYAAMCEFDAPAWEIDLFGETYIEIPDVLLTGVHDERSAVDGTVECTAVFQVQERP